MALFVNHQASVQKAREGNAVLLHAPDGGQNHFPHGTRMNGGCHHRRG